MTAWEEPKAVELAASSLDWDMDLQNCADPYKKRWSISMVCVNVGAEYRGEK